MTFDIYIFCKISDYCVYIVNIIIEIMSVSYTYAIWPCGVASSPSLSTMYIKSVTTCPPPSHSIHRRQSERLQDFYATRDAISKGKKEIFVAQCSWHLKGSYFLTITLTWFVHSHNILYNRNFLYLRILFSCVLDIFAVWYLIFVIKIDKNKEITNQRRSNINAFMFQK